MGRDGVQKVRALVGGFHLATMPQDDQARITTELKQQDIDHIFRMHLSGSNFLEAAQQHMPQVLLLCTTGNRFNLGQYQS